MTKILFHATLLLLFVSCKNKNEQNSIEKYLDKSIIVDSENVPKNPKEAYFPVELFRIDTGETTYDGEFTVEWYSEHLFALKEPLLYNKIPDREIFRFLWLRSEDPPVSIRIEKKKNEYSLTLKICDGYGGYYPGNLIVDKTKTIDKATWNSFTELVEKAEFWDSATNEDYLGIGASQWILESANKKRYHVVDRTSLETGNFYNCCMFLIKLVEEDIPGGVY
jgi:hypothetical protein